MPLFATTAPGIRVQQIAVVVMTFVPLWVLLARRAAARRRAEPAAVELNATWRPEPVAGQGSAARNRSRSGDDRAEHAMDRRSPARLARSPGRWR